jgi:hypothetical protein
MRSSHRGTSQTGYVRYAVRARATNPASSHLVIVSLSHLDGFEL